MKNLGFIIISLLICFRINANPIMVPYPPLLSEIYFDDYGNWTLELNTYFYSLIDLDYISIETNTGISSLIPGIQVTDSVVILTIDSLTTPLYINPAGDFIKIHGCNNDFPSESFFYFGAIEYSYVSPINSSQSYEIQSAPYNEWICYFVKENTPNIGYTNSEASSFGILSGSIVDEDETPISDVKLIAKVSAYNYETHPIYDESEYGIDLYYDHQISTDNYGLFYAEDIPARNFFLNFYSEDENYIYDTTIELSIEPELINDYHFVLDCDLIYVDLNEIESHDFELKNYPNPVSDRTTISCNIGNSMAYKNAIVKIFTINGELMKILPLRSVGSNDVLMTNCNLSGFSQGIYYYNLEIDGKKLASNQMVVIK